jgi:hypothetical protein
MLFNRIPKDPEDKRRQGEQNCAVDLAHGNQHDVILSGRPYSSAWRNASALLARKIAAAKE